MKMSDNSQLEMIREAAKRPPYKQTVYVNAGKLLAEIEREYFPRPRFEDDEPVQLGDEFIANGGTATTVTTLGVSIRGRDSFDLELNPMAVDDRYRLTIKSDERVKRPDFEVLDADGVPICKGDTVWDNNTDFLDCPITIKEITGTEIVGEYERGKIRYTLESASEHLTHKQPDSLERIEEDALMDSTDYCDKYGLLDSGCNAEEGDGAVRHCTDCGLTCEKRMTKHLLRRQREVLERGR